MEASIRVRLVKYHLESKPNKLMYAVIIQWYTFEKILKKIASHCFQVKYLNAIKNAINFD